MKNVTRFFYSLFSVALALCSLAHANQGNTMQRVIVMLGAPGAGKGTVAVKLSEELSLPHISTGDLFRANIGGKTTLGAKAKGYMDKGDLVPDKLVLDMLFARVQDPDCAKGYILDGFPRTLNQAEELTARLEGKADLIALSIEVAEDQLVTRIVNRRVCKACGAPFHLNFNPPAKAGECDRCKSELCQRDDDTEAVVTKRIAVYHKQTAPVETFYRAKGCVVAINGNKSPKEVLAQAKEKLAKRS